MLTGALQRTEWIATVTLEMDTTAIAHHRDTNAHANQMTGTAKAKLGTYAMTITATTAQAHTQMERAIGVWTNQVSFGI